MSHNIQSILKLTADLEQLEVDTSFDLANLEDDNPFNSIVSSKHCMDESPMAVPDYNPTTSNSSDSSAHFIILDPSPPNSPVNSPQQTTCTLSKKSRPNLLSVPSEDEHVYSDSIALDLEHVLSFKESDYKKLHFRLSRNLNHDFMVSMDLDQSALRIVPKRTDCPLALPQSTASPQELMSCSEMLQSAKSRAMVRADSIESANCDEIEYKERAPSPSVIGLHLPSEEDKDYLTSPRTQQFMNIFMEQDLSINEEIHFDKISVTESNQKTVLLDSKGLTSGKYEWSVQIWRADCDLQEIGVIGVRDIDKIPVSDGGAFETKGFGSRALYGCALSEGTIYYGSCNANGEKRCHRDLRPFFNVGWTVGDVVTVRLDLDRFRIKYMLNGKAVRYTMSLEPDREYFPMMCFSGNAKYFLH